jgi:exosome complex RNA-binding protein Csl4
VWLDGARATFATLRVTNSSQATSERVTAEVRRGDIVQAGVVIAKRGGGIVAADFAHGLSIDLHERLDLGV